MTSAIVVGSGPNGLAAAITLAQAGVHVTVIEAAERIGGGARSSELTVPGLVHDDCSGFHPLGAASPFFRSLNLHEYGLRWRWAPIDVAHPLDDGRAAVLTRSMRSTVAHLGADGPAWRRLFAPLADGFDALIEDVLRPISHLPHHPLRLGRFATHAVRPASVVARRFRTDEARALFAGVAAHIVHPLSSPLSSSVGLVLTAAAHVYGWPVAEGGSQAITTALSCVLRALGGTIQTGFRVTSLDQLPPTDIVMLDVTPAAAADIIGERLPRRVARAYRRYRHGPGVVKVDLAVTGGVPWTNELCRQAGTLHLGGTIEEIGRAEHDVAMGRMPPRPFVLVGQQYLADPSRSKGDLHPIWAYAHVPAGYSDDVTDTVIAQIERFAPGVRSRIRAQFTRSPSDMARYNANYVGGDIAAGANDPFQIALRPRVTTNPYRTGVDGVYLCSAATAPGAGVHGMCGFHAARTALLRVGITPPVIRHRRRSPGPPA